MTTYLGIDYGRSHLGIALSEHILATPLATLDNSSLAAVIQRLSKYLADHHVDQIICGLPEGELKPEIEAFAKSLRQSLHLPVILHPETLTSQDAISKLREGNASLKKLQNDHAYAACLILEDYLEQQKSA